MGFGPINLDQILNLPLISSATLPKLLHLSVPIFKGEDNILYIIGLTYGLHALTYAKQLCLAH